MERNVYQLKAKMLKRKYGKIAEEFSQYKDDRLLVASASMRLTIS